MSSATDAAMIRAHTIAVPKALLSHRRQVARWAFASGRPVHRDALAAIVGARAAGLADPSTVGAGATWTVDDIGELLWSGIPTWCAKGRAHLPQPHDVARTLDTYLRYLSSNRRLDRGSDPVAALRRAITDFGGRRSRSHPAVRHSLVAPVVPIA